MKPIEEKYSRRRYKNAYGTSIFSITLVLFMLGLLFMMIFYAGRLSMYFRENIGISVMLDVDAKEAEIINFKKAIEKQKFVKSINYVSKDEAAAQLMEELGEDFVDFIGYNPLPPTLELFVYEDYTQPDSLQTVKSILIGHSIVKGVEYQHELIEMIDKNIARAGRWVVLFCLMLLSISVMLIHNTIRLSIYSRRLLIKSMLLVGATQQFIRRPFIKGGIDQGLISGIISVCLLLLLLFIVSLRFPELGLMAKPLIIALMAILIIGFGVLISWGSTYFAVKKYLKIKSEELY